MSTFAKIKFATDIAKIASGMISIKGAADGAEKVSTFTKALKAIGEIKTSALSKVSTLFTNIKGLSAGTALTSLKALFTTDLAELLGAGGATTGATIGLTIASSIASAIAGYNGGKWGA